MTGKEKYRQLVVFSAAVMNEFDGVCAENGLNRTEISMLSLIRRADLAGKCVISTQIARELNITRSAVSQTVDRLEEKGYVCRVSSDSDKKIAYILLTEEYQARVDERMKQNIARTETVLREMGENADLFLRGLQRFRFLNERVKKEEEE